MKSSLCHVMETQDSSISKIPYVLVKKIHFSKNLFFKNILTTRHFFCYCFINGLQKQPPEAIKTPATLLKNKLSGTGAFL